MRFFYNDETKSLYYLNDNALMVMPMHADNTFVYDPDNFDTDEAYEVWEWDEMLRTEPVGDYRLKRTLADVWAEARKALTTKKFFINGSEVTEDRFETEINDNFNVGVAQVVAEDEDGNATLTYDETYGEGQ